MIKAFCRSFLLLFTCLLFVYAPEIITGISAPYSLKPPERTLLRITLCCEDNETASSAYHMISGYHKEYPHIHLRITRISPDLLPGMRPPYPDVFLIPRAGSAQLPTNASLHETQPLLCAVVSDSRIYEEASNFASYLYNAAFSTSGLPSYF